MWRHEAPDGVGVFTYRGGDVYRGDVSGGRRHGRGELRYASGDCYTGLFQHDLREGEGGVLVTVSVSSAMLCYDMIPYAMLCSAVQCLMSATSP